MLSRRRAVAVGAALLLSLTSCGAGQVADGATSGGVPALVTLTPDEWQAKHVGRTEGGRLYFLTTPFEPTEREYLALYLFHPDGTLNEALIDDLGHRDDLDERAVGKLVQERLESLGERSVEEIRVKPFSVARFGTEFGLIPQRFDGVVTVNAMPGDYMSFNAPFNDGEYDT